MNERYVLDTEDPMIVELKHEIYRIKEEKDKLVKQVEDLDMKNGELRGKIKFLEGQIEAYQYCMNCRR